MTTIGVFCSSATDVDETYHELARATGAAIGARGWTLL